MIPTAAKMEALRTIAVVAAVFGAATTAIVLSNHPTAAPPPGVIPPGTIPDYWGSRVGLSGAADIAPPSGCLDLDYPATEASLRAYLGEIPDYYGYYYYPQSWLLSGGREGDGAVATAGSAAPPAAPDHSGTNNQVAGVDELDHVKTDGWFIYTAMGGRIVTARAYPPTAMEVVSTIELGGYAYGIFVEGDRLAVVLQPAYPSPYPTGDGAVAGMSIAPYFYNPEVEVRVYDITDRAAPEILFNYSISGSLAGARMIGDFVYLVTGYTIYRVGDDLRLPTVSRNGALSEIAASSIAVPPGTFNTTSLTTVVSVNVTGSGDAKTFAYLTQGGGQIYVSTRNLYVLGTSYTYTPEWMLASTETVVSKLSFYKGDVLCYFAARVPGTILNQFSADEADIGGHLYLRLATTVRTGEWANSSASVYVLDERLELVGSVEGIAPGETIQTSRFMGERGYLVTFRRVDPLFVLDLSDPAHPEVVGELTLPGFSQYLQAIDPTHLIGIGVDGTEEGRILGLKLSLFDVSDPAAPVEVDNVTFGESAYSEAQYDHKAVLYVASMRLLVIPLQTYDYSVDRMVGGGSWQGAIVFAVDAAAGFTEKARIAHQAVEYGKDYYGQPYVYQPPIRRALYIGEYLYTVSDYSISANYLDGFSSAGSLVTGAPAGWLVGYGGGGVAVSVPPSTGSAGGA